MHRIISARHGLVACLISLAITVALVEPLSALASTGGIVGT